MAIGVRILSNNLNGQTANVTFLPTSGGTINLGTKTIPFNNITTDPYGVYQLYFPEYGYTYELTVNQAVDGHQSFIFLSGVIGNNTWGASVLDFNDLTAEVINFDIDMGGCWYIDSLYPLTNSGYGVYFYNDCNCDFSWVFFLDSAGNVIDEFKVNTNCNYDYDILSGKIVLFLDETNGWIKYFDGVNVYTQTCDPSYQSFYLQSGWDGIASDGMTFPISIYDSTGNTYTNYLINGNSMTQFGDVIDNGTSYQTIQTYFDGNFVSQLLMSAGTFVNLNLYSLTGGTLQSVDLTASGTFTYDNYYFNYYGNNKMYVSFWNNGDVNMDYTIIHYDGNTDYLQNITHVRGSNYESLWSSSNTNLYPNNGGSDAFSILLAHVNNWDDIGGAMTYCDILYMLSGDTDISTYQFQSSGSANKSIQTGPDTSNTLSFLCNNGDGMVSVLSLLSGGTANTNSTGVPVSGFTGYWNYGVGNGYVYVIFESPASSCTLVHIKSDNTLGGVINNIALPDTYAANAYRYGDIFQFYNYSGLTYYVTDMFDTFQSGTTITGNSINIYYTSSYFKEDFRYTGPLLTIDTTNKDVHLLSSTGYTSSVFPQSASSWDIAIGKDKILYVYIDTTSNYLNINLYDFNLNLLNNYETTHTYYWFPAACKDRYVVIVDEAGIYYQYLVTETDVTSAQLTNYNSWYTMNDYVWWD